MTRERIYSTETPKLHARKPVTLTVFLYGLIIGVAVGFIVAMQVLAGMLWPQ